MSSLDGHYSESVRSHFPASVTGSFVHHPGRASQSPVRSVIGSHSNHDQDRVTEVQPEETKLPDNLLNILGGKVHPDKVVGEALQKNIALNWEEVVKKGLPKKFVEEILLKYPIPSNCPYFDPPQLNLEVKAAIQEASRIRDGRISTKQESIAAGLTAIGKALTLSLESQDVKMVEYLNDAGRILADIHHTESDIRRSLILQNVHTTFKETLTAGSSDSMLFGADLEERLKSAKALDRASKDLRKDVITKPAVPKTQSKNFKSPFGGQNTKQQYYKQPYYKNQRTPSNGQRTNKQRYQPKQHYPSQRQDRSSKPAQK